MCILLPVEHEMVTMYKVAFTEWWIQISGVMMDMMSKNAGMIYLILWILLEHYSGFTRLIWEIHCKLGINHIESM